MIVGRPGTCAGGPESGGATLPVPPVVPVSPTPVPGGDDGPAGGLLLPGGEIGGWPGGLEGGFTGGTTGGLAGGLTGGFAGGLAGGLIGGFGG